jgi:hypothetical protein
MFFFRCNIDFWRLRLLFYAVPRNGTLPRETLFLRFFLVT